MRMLFGRIKEDFGMIATLLGFIVDSLAIIALVSQEVTPSIPVLGPSVQFLIWMLALFSYLGFLRDYWRKYLQKETAELYDSRFEYFLFSDLPRLKNPYALLGFVFLFFMLIWIIGSIPTIDQILAVGFFIIGLFGLAITVGVFISKRNEEEKTWQEWEYLEDEDTIKLWFSRIGKEFAQVGYVVDYDLAALYSTSQSFIYKVMRKFVDQYGAKYDVYFVTETISREVPSSIQPKETVTEYRYPSVLTRRHNLQDKPWLLGWERYFNYD